MLKKVWNWIKSLFTTDKIGKIWEILFTATKSAVANALSDPENQRKAYEIVSTLQMSGLSEQEKGAEFVTRFKAWASSVGRSIGTSTVNALRENALAALKAQLEQVKNE